MKTEKITKTTVTYKDSTGATVSKSIIGHYDAAWRARAEAAGTARGCRDYVWIEETVEGQLGGKQWIASSFPCIF